MIDRRVDNASYKDRLKPASDLLLPAKRLGASALRKASLARQRHVVPSDDPMKPFYNWYGKKQLTMEGFSTWKQSAWFRELLEGSPEITRIAEIGFNAGHSSYNFLSARPDIQVTSFDIGEHDYVHAAKMHVDTTFPDRHKLVLGDSQDSLPMYAQSNPIDRFDLIFIDGGHDLEIARADLENARRLAHKDTIVVMDDYNPTVPWGEGPVQAWDEAVQAGQVFQREIASHGDRVWAVGSFVGLSRQPLQ